MALSISPVQTGRLLALTTPLGADVLLATDLTGTEALSELFQFTVSMVSANDGLTDDQLLGKSVTLAIARPGGDPRYINGVVTSFSAADQVVSGLRRYVAVVEPKLWLLTRTTDCRIFQNQTVTQIAKTLLSEGGITNYKTQLTGTYASRDYCVQYRESDYDFLVRILTEEGIYFYFSHESGKHTLVLSDNTAGYGTCADGAVHHAPPLSNQTQAVHTWSRGYRYQSGKTTLKDYDFEQPSSDISATTSTVLSNSSFKSWEIFDYPGDYTKKADGSTLSRSRMEIAEAAYAQAEGTSSYPGFAAGTTFTMAKHDISSEENQSYVLVRVQHTAQDASHLGNQTERSSYSNSFTALSAKTTYRPPRPAPRPLIPGPQTATVVGPSGEEVYCDKYGRIRLQFHWDRLGKKDDSSSCWVRVSQGVAGSGWGMQFTPRVGMEVVVVFLEGDPDRPLVVGSVYNGENLPPFTLPDNKTQSGIKTRSSSKGSASTYNELRFEDKKDGELVYMRAQKDFTRAVVNDDALTVGNDQTTTIKKNRTETIEEGNDSLTISKGNSTTAITSGNQSITLGSGNFTLQCDGGNITLSAADTLTLKVGSNSLTITQSGMTLKATQISITGDTKVQVSSSMVNVKGDGTVEIKGGLVKIN